MNLMDPNFTAEDQYKRLLLSDRITYTPSYFFNKQAILSVGGYDEDTAFIEDYPMWLKLTRSGTKLCFMEKVTVAYRLHENSLNSKLELKLFNPQYLRTEAMRKVHVYPHLPWDLVGQMKFKYIMSLFFEKMGLNKSTKIHQKIYRIFTVFINPFQYIISIKKHILGFDKTNIFYAG